MGPFRDERQRVYRDAGRLLDARPIRVRQLGGGLMSFRASKIRNQLFDTNLTGACPGEDIEFCAGLPREWVLRIAPKARLIHNRSPESQDLRAGSAWMPKSLATCGNVTGSQDCGTIYAISG